MPLEQGAVSDLPCISDVILFAHIKMHRCGMGPAAFSATSLHCTDAILQVCISAPVVTGTFVDVHRCNQLQQVLPGPISKWLKVLSQPWEGDVTMVLPSTYSQIKKAVTNPSKRDLQIACLQVLLSNILALCPQCCGAFFVINQLQPRGI